MYHAKSSGGGQHCLFDAQLAEQYQRKVEVENSLTEAVERGEFKLAFQPQIDLRTGEVSGAEALLRWYHPREGLRLPTTFIDIAERTGAINEIGDWVIGEVAATLAHWRRGRTGTRISFNVSPRQIERNDFFIKLRETFARAEIPLSMVELEFTESAAMEVGQPVLVEIAALRRDGARVAIDDFGTGYSNIARLRTMPLDRVKLDPSIIADIESCAKARVVVQAVVQLVRGVGCEVIAEAVETAAQADILRAMGCDTVQGFVFAPAMFEEEFLEWVGKAAGNGSRGALAS
jgi:EAL domain-containing protein (putative c-di-GMP-specific phosphodiesterase class I)